MDIFLPYKGQVVCIDPLASSSHYFPDEKVSKTMKLIEKANGQALLRKNIKRL